MDYIFSQTNRHRIVINNRCSSPQDSEVLFPVFRDYVIETEDLYHRSFYLFKELYKHRTGESLRKISTPRQRRDLIRMANDIKCFNGIKWNDTLEKRSLNEIRFDDYGRMFFPYKQVPCLIDSKKIKKNYNFKPRESKENFLCFVISENNKLYADQFIRGKIHHNSLVAGRPVKSAGIMYVTDGQIDYLQFYSGHYRTDAIGAEQFVKFLMKKGLDQNEKFLFSNRFNTENLLTEHSSQTEHLRIKELFKRSFNLVNTQAEYLCI